MTGTDLLNKKKIITTKFNSVTGRVIYNDLSEHLVRTTEEFDKLTKEAFDARSTRITLKNKSGSSRSAAILRVKITNSENKDKYGEICVVDMPGSEYLEEQDTSKIGKEEAMVINFLNMILKGSFRQKAEQRK